MKAIVKNIPEDANVETSEHYDTFVEGMFHDGIVEEFTKVYDEWYVISDDEDEFNYHQSWLEFVD